MKNHLDGLREFVNPNSPKKADNPIGKIMSAHDDRGFLKELLQLGFFSKRIEERAVISIYKQMGWTYKTRCIPPTKSGCDLYVCSFMDEKEIHASVKCNSSTRVFWGIKLLIEIRHHGYSKSRGISTIISTPEQIEMLSLSVATIAVVPPMEVLTFYRKKMAEPTIAEIIQEFDVIEPIARVALDLFNHYYNPNHKNKNPVINFH